MGKASLEYLFEAAKRQNLKSLVVEQLNEARVCLEKVANRIPELIKADKIFCQKLTNDNSSQKELDVYRPIHGKSFLELVQVAVKVWNDELEKFDASDFLSERETPRLVSLMQFSCLPRWFVISF